MARTESVIFTNMCMITDGEGHVLVQDRLDPNWPGITFPGGHVEPGENFSEAVIRQVWEETGLTIKNPILCGIKHWMRKDGSRYVVLLYKTSSFSGELCSSEEGPVFWIDRKDFLSYRYATDMDLMIQVFESDDLSEMYFFRDSENDPWQSCIV